MIIIRLSGGLGNQMFQFALYRKLQAMQRDVCIYDMDLRGEGAEHNGLELERVFGLNYVTSKSFRRYVVESETIAMTKNPIYENAYAVYEEGYLYFKPEIFTMDNVCLRGCWQSEKYFKEVAKQVRKDFSFPKIMGQQNICVLKAINDSQSVAVHVRRGDYLKEGYKDIFGSVCNEDYYKKAIYYMKTKVSDAKLFIFSNDIEWCKRNFETENVIFVEGNNEKDSYKDMQLMSLCKHQIVANSSFSWWAAWLNCNKNKIVIAPPKWLNGVPMDDIVCEDWVKMK